VPLTFTPGAVARSKALLAEKSVQWLRVGIRSGGCSGMSYFLDFVAEPDANDKQFDHDGLRVCVDKKSYLFLIGTEVAWEESLVKQGFVFNNPAAKRSCSCGESFSV
jgi:iron-sulfur cluster assembly protein